MNASASASARRSKKFSVNTRFEQRIFNPFAYSFTQLGLCGLILSIKHHAFLLSSNLPIFKHFREPYSKCTSFVEPYFQCLAIEKTKAGCDTLSKSVKTTRPLYIRANVAMRTQVQ